MKKLIDLDSGYFKYTAKILLEDKTTKKNITWSTKTYEHLGEDYKEDAPIEQAKITGVHSYIIQPRVYKSQTEQAERTKKKAEVFTPTWLCNKMNNFCDEEWFGRKGVFNTENEDNTWTVNPEKIEFTGKKTWKHYVDSRRLEITCGEAPYLVSRYDATTGDTISIENRIGILDRKMRVVNENATDEEWMKWTIRAFQSTYGYEYQGDNLLLARVNMLMSFADYYENKWGRIPEADETKKLANIIAWNLWQMDGLKGIVPQIVPEKEEIQLSLEGVADIETTEEKETVECKYMNWRKDNSFLYSTLKEGKMKFDFVIGNPPYQEESNIEITTNGQRPRKNIFHHFQLQADEISRMSSVLIYPGIRWIHQSGKGLKQFGKEQMNDTRLSIIEFYPDTREVFGQAAELPDGVTIVVKSQQKKTGGFKYLYNHKGLVKEVFTDNPGDDLLPLNPNNIAIANKIKLFVDSNNLNYLHEAILPRSLFAIESDFVENNKDKVVELDKTVDFSDFSNKIKLYTNDKAGPAGRSKWFIADRSVIKSNVKYIDEWQVVVSSAHPGGQDGRDWQMSIVDNQSAFGRARVALRSFKTAKEAENFYNYANSDIVKFSFLLTDEVLGSLAKLVPDIINYSDSNNLLDFNANLDTQLFQLLKLTEDEMDYIKNTVTNNKK